MTIMQEIVEGLHINKTWKLVPFSNRKKNILVINEYKIKQDKNGQIEKYRTRLVIN